MSTIKSVFVTDGKGNYLVQSPSDSQFGFCLSDDDQSYEGGFGSGFKSWESVTINQVPDKVRDRLGWLLEL